MFSLRMNNFLFNLAAIFRVTVFDEMTKGKKKKKNMGFYPRLGAMENYSLRLDTQHTSWIFLKATL